MSPPRTWIWELWRPRGPARHAVLPLKEGRVDLLGLGAFWKRPEAISELSGSRLGAS